MGCFSDADRQLLLAVKGVGPTVITRLEALELTTSSQLSQQDPKDICGRISILLGASCWRNSPQAFRSIEAAVVFARKLVSDSTKSVALDGGLEALV